MPVARCRFAHDRPSTKSDTVFHHFMRQKKRIMPSEGPMASCQVTDLSALFHAIELAGRLAQISPPWGAAIKHNSRVRAIMTKQALSKLTKAGIGLAGLALLATAPGPATAQSQNPELRPREVYDLPPRKPTTPVPASESMEPQGGRVGNFVVFPSIEFSTGYDSNIFATNTNEEGDFIFRLLPRVRLENDLSPVRLNLEAVGLVTRYADNSSEDAEGFLLSHDGSWEVPALGEQSFLKWGVAHSRDWLDRGLPDDTNNGTEPTIVHTSLGYAGFQYKPGPLSISPRFSARHSDFDDVGTTGGTTINNDDRDRWIFRETLRVGYEFVPGYEGYMRGTLNQRRYDTTPDDAGFDRNSDGYEAVVGAKIGLSEITNFDVFAGYLSQSYDDPRLPNVEGMSFGGQLNWSPRREWRFAASVTRSVDETNLSDYASYLNTTYAVSANYQLFPNLQLDARIAYSQFDFERPSSTAASREDDMVMGQIGMRYYVTPNYYVRATFQQTAYSSDVANEDYDRSVVFLTLGAQY